MVNPSRGSTLASTASKERLHPPHQDKTAHDDLRDIIFAPSSRQVGSDLGLANKPSGVWSNGINGRGVFTPISLEGNSMIPAFTPIATDRSWANAGELDVPWWLVAQKLSVMR